ncbi:MAG: MotA/TolQ/ExbB proton channel family protein [Bacteriovoracaceae bacterium]|nr:MotA/TolQ/ExbB proton channel family protein [Bacteriovoracaceae bacterium]
MRLVDYINQGGAIMYVLLFLNIVGLATMLYKFVILLREQKRTNSIAEKLKEKILEEEKNYASETLIELAKQEVSSFMSELEKGLSTVKIVASISPLLGLLGTVIGVLVAFRVMSTTGINNPASFAQGISMALITTVGGLIVAIPHYIGHSYLLRIIDHMEITIEKKLISKLF